MVLIIIGIILVFTGRYIVRLGHELSTEIIKNLIKVETDGQYEIDFAEVNLDVRRKKLTIDDLVLLPVNDPSSYQRTIYEVHIDKVQIHLESLKSIYLRRELAVDSVRIVDPRLKLSNPPVKNDSLSFSVQTGDLYQIIHDQLSVLRIDKFRIENADLEHYPSNFKLEDIQFSINELLMDSTGVGDRVFYSSKIILEINNQKLLLPDSIHEVGFEKFVLSTSDSVLRFTNAFIKPADSTQVSFYNVNDFNVYDITLPSIALQGVDYVRAYVDNVLAIDHVSITQPSILIDDETENQRLRKKEDNNLLKLLADVFDEIQIGHFELTEANVDIKLFGGAQEQRLSSKRTGISMFGIHLDTINAELSNDYSYFDSARFTLFDYQYNLPDSVHQIKVERFTLDTKDSSMRFENMHLKPAHYADKRKQFAWLEIPRGELTGARFEMALLGDKLRLKDFNLYNPSLKIKRPAQKDSHAEPKVAITPKDLYELLSIRYREFVSRGVNIYDARFEVEEMGAINNLNIGIQNIALDHTDSLWTDLLKSLNVQTGQVTWQLDTLTASFGSVDISNKGRHIVLNNVRIDEPTQKLSLAVKNLELRGHRPNMVALGDFYTDTLVLNQPSLIVNGKIVRSESDTSSLDFSQGILPPSIGYLIVENGSIRISVDSAMTSLNELKVHLSSNENHPIEVVSFANLTGTVTNPFDISYSVSSSNYDKESRHLIMSNISLRNSDSLWVQIPTARIEQVYQKGLLQGHHLLTSSIGMGAIRGRLDLDRLKDLVTAQKGESKSTITTANMLLDIEDFVLYKEGNQVLFEDFNVQLVELSTANHDLFSSDHMIFSENLGLSGEVMLVGREGDSLHLLGLDYQSKEKQLTIKAMEVQSPEKLNGNVYGLSLGDFPIDDYINHKRLAIGKLSVDSSNLNVIRSDKQISRSVLQLPWKALSVKEFDLTENDLYVVDRLLQSSTEINAFYLKGKQLVVDSLVDTRRWFQYLTDLSLGGQKFDESLNENYRMQIGQYRYNLAQNKIQLNQLRLLPEKDRYTYSSTLEKQTSWFDVSVDSLSVFNPDLEAFANGRVHIPKVILSNAFADIYRDKTIPFPEDQYMPMPQKSLHDIGYPIWIDTLALTANIRYAEKPEDSEEEGIMTFDDIAANLFNLRTLDTLNNITMRFAATGKIYNEAPFSVRVNFDQHAPAYKYRMTGAVRDFDLTLLDQMLGPVAGVNIRSGYGEEIEFDFEANDDVATGEMRFRYDNLRITILNKKTREAQGGGSGIKSFFANTFVVKKKNPGLAFFVKKGDIFYERDTSRAIFNYWGKSLISGAVSSIGINRSTRAHKRYIKDLEEEEKELQKLEKQKTATTNE